MFGSVQSITPSIGSLQAAFLEVLPRIERQASICFSEIRCSSRRADCVAEAVALAWKWFIRLARRGKDATRFVCALTTLAARAVRSGRRACGQVRSNDVFSRTAQRRFGFTIRSVATGRRSHSGYGSPMDDVLEDQLMDNTATSPLDQAQFRLDFGAWLKRFSARQHRIIRALSSGERTRDVSRRFDITAGRVSQMRLEFKKDWERFIGDNVDNKKSINANTPESRKRTPAFLKARFKKPGVQVFAPLAREASLAA